jgi:hypothetical protein
MMVVKLTLQTQVVLDAANNVSSYGPDDCLNESRWIAAAALRAAADQVAPQNYQAGIDISADDDGGWVNGAETRNEEIRAELLAIAAELETSTTENR